MESTLVSIIIPLYNRGHQIKETLDSVVNQTYNNWELIIVDDGSKDNSISVAKTYQTENNNIFIFNRNREPSGPCTCRNIGLTKAKGEYIIFLDSDDILAKDCLQKRIKKMDKTPNLNFGVFNAYVFYEKIQEADQIFNKHPTENRTYLDMFLNIQIPWQTTAVIWKIEYIKSINGWNEKLLTKTDPELHIRALLNYPNYKVFKKCLPDYYYRINNLDSDKKEYFLQRTLVYWEPFFKTVYNNLRNINATERQNKLFQLRIGLLNVIKYSFFKFSNKFPKDYITFVTWANQNNLLLNYEYWILKLAHRLKCKESFFIKKLRIIGFLHACIKIPRNQIA